MRALLCSPVVVIVVAGAATDIVGHKSFDFGRVKVDFLSTLANESRISQQNPAGNIDYRIESSRCLARISYSLSLSWPQKPNRTKPNRSEANPTCIHNSKLALELLKCLLWFLPHGTHIAYHGCYRCARISALLRSALPLILCYML